MGLDTFTFFSPNDIELNSEDAQAFLGGDIQLSGGMFSGGGGSFLGKLDRLLLREITSESVHQEWIPPDTVQAMYTMLKKCGPQQAID